MNLGQQLFWVGTGGGIGALGRYGLLEWLGSVDNGSLPWGTLVANMLGSLLLGLVIGLAERQAIGRPAQLFLAIGLLGGFTTFSFFSYENLELIRDSQMLSLTANVSVQLVFGLLAAAAGYYSVARRSLR